MKKSHFALLFPAFALLGTIYGMILAYVELPRTMAYFVLAYVPILLPPFILMQLGEGEGFHVRSVLYRGFAMLSGAFSMPAATILVLHITPGDIGFLVKMLAGGTAGLTLCLVGHVMILRKITPDGQVRRLPLHVQDNRQLPPARQGYH